MDSNPKKQDAKTDVSELRWELQWDNSGFGFMLMWCKKSILQKMNKVWYINGISFVEYCWMMINKIT